MEGDRGMVNIQLNVQENKTIDVLKHFIKQMIFNISFDTMNDEEKQLIADGVREKMDLLSNLLGSVKVIHTDFDVSLVDGFQFFKETIYRIS